MKIQLLNTQIFIDKWKGKNYGIIPVKIDGENFKKKLDKNIEWEIIEIINFFDKRNDNQIDIEREIDYIYFNKKIKQYIFIKVEKSRSEKTRKWTYKFYKTIK